jgi:hypothetical protein
MTLVFKIGYWRKAEAALYACFAKTNTARTFGLKMLFVQSTTV